MVATYHTRMVYKIVPYTYGMYQLYAYGIKYVHGTEHYYAKEHSSITISKFSGSDIIASAGSYPKDINKKWNAPTICMSVILIKCSAATGQLLIVSSQVATHNM